MSNTIKYRNNKPMSDDGELWYRVPGFDQDEVYISELGNVVCNGYLCKPNYNCKGGYGRVTFLKDRYRVHQLVGRVILGESDLKLGEGDLKGLEPHHINGNPADNQFENICLVSPETNNWLASTTRLINKVIRYAIDNNYPVFARLSDVEQKYLEFEFLTQSGDQDELEKIYLEYTEDKRINIKAPSDRIFIGPRIDEYVGISLQELEDRLMIKNREVCKLSKFYHRDNAIRNYLNNLIGSSIQEIRLNDELSRSLMTDRVRMLYYAMHKVIQEDNLNDKLRVEDRGSRQKYSIKL
jgi:hypothetical protein